METSSKSKAKLRDRFIDHPINASGGLPIPDSDERTAEINQKYLKNHQEPKTITILKKEKREFKKGKNSFIIWIAVEGSCGIISLSMAFRSGLRHCTTVLPD
jgi:hypothetical protein